MDFELEKQDEGWAEAFRHSCHTEAERPAHFWSTQRAQVRVRIAAKDNQRPFWLVIASTAALFMIAAALLLGDHAPAPVHVATTSSISDQQLLADIDDTLSNPIPDALAPVTLISEDMDRSLKASGKKETR